MKILGSLILLFLVTQAHCQGVNKSNEIVYYKNGTFKNSQKLKFYVIANSDTIFCPIVKNKIRIPQIPSPISILIIADKNKYKIENVETAKFDKNFTGGSFNDQYTVSNSCGPVTSWTISTASGPTTYTASSGNINITGANNNNLQISGTGGAPLTSVCANLASGLTVCANMSGATNT